MRYIGVDLHQTNFMVCYLDSETQEKTYRTWALEELSEFVEGLEETDEIAVEATGNTLYFRDAVLDSVSKVVVVSPRQFKVIRQSVKKTDKNDASALAVYLSKDLLPTCRVKSKSHNELLEIVGTRDKLVKQKTQCVNRIHSLLNARGIKVKKERLTSKKGLEALKSYTLDEVCQLEVEMLSNQIDSLKSGIKRLEEKIESLAEKVVGYESLRSMTGIGAQSAAILLSVIGDVNDFEDKDKLSSYFGIVPRVRNSNEKEVSGRITKRGNKLGRTTLVQSTLVAIRYSEYLRHYYDGIKARRGSGKAIIATARKYLGIIYDALKEGWVFEDFNEFVLVEQ